MKSPSQPRNHSLAKAQSGESRNGVATLETPMIPESASRQGAHGISGDWLADAAKFRALVENSTEVICLGKPDGTIFYTTPSIRRVLGYDPAFWMGRNAFEIMRPDHAELARNTLRNLEMTPTGTVLRQIVQVRHADGSWKWVEGVLTNLIGEPTVGGIVCNYRDITESRQAEEALRGSEQLYRLLTESLPQMISVRDTESNVEYCNCHWREYHGITGSEAAPCNWRDGFAVEGIPALDAPKSRRRIPKPWQGECRIRRVSDGTFRWHSVRVVPLPAPAPAAASQRLLVIANDIHERKQAEQERERLLRQLERDRSELAVQYAAVRVLAETSTLADAAPRLLAAFCEQLGWQAGALWITGNEKSSRRALSLIHIRQQPDVAPAGRLGQCKPEPLKRGQSLAGRVWKHRHPLASGKLSAHRGAAHHRVAAKMGLQGAFAFPVMLAGEVQGVVELFTRENIRPAGRLLDIFASVGILIGLFMERTHALDQLRHSEEALIQANNALERRVRERTAELHEANHELSSEILERTRLEREIIRISEREQRRIGHDLHDGVCQELAAIAFITRALGTRLGKSSNPETHRINQVAHLLNDCIGRCRDIARGLHPVELDSDGLMVALKELATRTDKTVACTFKCDHPILMPESDMALNLYRIAQEAVNNAVKYARASRITISLDRHDSALRLSISDDGRGIPGRTPRSAPKRPRKPGGMGLHIMRYRARTMGATLRINDRRPRGTEILCLLPRK